MKTLFLSAALIIAAGSVLAQHAPKSTIVEPDAMTWTDSPVQPKGAKFAVLLGDPRKAGEIFVLRVEFPPNYRLPAHTHPYTGYSTVISGSYYYGEGDKLDMQQGRLLKAGTFYVEPANHAHYAWTTTEGAIVQTQGIGPAGTDYINPADDPRKSVGSTAQPPK
jgi:quercetin dioxygenase-like cupin family protein